MGKPYSQDLRERVIATVDSGTRVCAAARRMSSRAMVSPLPPGTAELLVFRRD